MAGSSMSEDSGQCPKLHEYVTASVLMDDNGLPVRFEVPASVDPTRIQPANPRAARNAGLVRVAADVLDDLIQMLFVADDSVVRLLLPEFSGERFLPVDGVGPTREGQ